ncbi:uncharacterized protein LOC106160267 [Lingula anatina]|uniref:Uncharacterized protein LOC106160267 n=1 Tax=Lingula anatina TaxID=7574 RepID=A0A1S3I4H5_LINAN|nr:uncharacterized protein LOC106160267 [Lingula anatina]|eukprot:XP_013392269.1 uncharacterized protein LOC106160267 [Lingula anatina]
MAEKVREEEHGVPIAFGTDKKKKEQLLKVMGEKVREVEHDVPIAFDTKYKKGIEHLSKGEDIKYVVSIFYAREDKQEVEKLSKDLAGQGVTCMLIESDPLHGLREKDMISYALKQSRRILLYITTHNLQDWRYETERIMYEVMSQQKQVIPVYRDITSEEQRIEPLPLRHLIPIDSRKEGFLKHLSMRIKGEEYDVSIFYDKRDEMEVEQLSQDLAGQGMTCMLIESDHLLGVRVEDMFEYALKQSRRILLYITTHYLQEFSWKYEAKRLKHEAMPQEKVVIPVYGDITSEEQRKLPLPLRHLIPIDSRKEGFLKHLSMRIKGNIPEY